MKNIITILIIWVISMTLACAQTTVTSKTVVAPEVLTLNLNGKVEVKETKGTRVIVETYVSTKGSNKTANIAANYVTPEFDEINATLKSSKFVIVNNNHIETKYIIFVPKGTEVKYN